MRINGRAYHRYAIPASSVPLCSRCGQAMRASTLPVARTTVGARVGAPALPRRVLPTWSCAGCGVQQPRVEDEP